jgi:hypothetical protein
VSSKKLQKGVNEKRQAFGLDTKAPIPYIFKILGFASS